MFLNPDTLRELRYGNRGRKPKMKLRQISELTGLSEPTLSKRLEELK